MSEPEVILQVSDGVGRIRLNRPRAINALNLAMIRSLWGALSEWVDDPDVTRVELTGAGERGLCAGADVRALREQVLAGEDPTPFFAEEYQLNLLIAEYPKPYTAVMTGVTMGGGMGLSVHGSDRVVDASSRLAMPETQIGLFPDVFVRWWLARLPAQVGTHLALTGTPIGAAEALALGLADRAAGELTPAVSGHASWIAECYAGDDPVSILERLSEHADPAARAAAAEIAARSPLSVAVSLAALRRAAAAPSLASLAAEELTLAVNLATGPDFAEGVRAQLVDRDKTPRWHHASLAEVSRADVAAVFGEQVAQSA